MPVLRVADTYAGASVVGGVDDSPGGGVVVSVVFSGVGVAVGSGVGSGVTTGVGVGSGVGTGVGSGVVTGAGVGLGVAAGVGVGVTRAGVGVGVGVGAGAVRSDCAASPDAAAVHWKVDGPSGPVELPSLYSQIAGSESQFAPTWARISNFLLPP